MKKRPYKRRAGDLEIRILSDGRVVMIAPDQELMEVARVVDRNSTAVKPITESNEDAARRQAQTNKQG
jgi:hypothetical protein